jgi:hypothetical protein
MVASQARLLDELAISRRVLVPGASMDGMQALRWGLDTLCAWTVSWRFLRSRVRLVGPVVSTKRLAERCTL